MGNPRALLLDEPSEGLAPIVVERMVAAIRALKAEGLCIVLSEQNLRFARQVADSSCLLERGRIRACGPLEAVQAQYALA
jgi:branched-chain amino acid transport system ATP-binding protein